MGTLDWGLIADHERICPIPFTTPECRATIEVWFDRNWTRTAEHPGPCTCHYAVP